MGQVPGRTRLPQLRTFTCTTLLASHSAQTTVTRCSEDHLNSTSLHLDDLLLPGQSFTSGTNTTSLCSSSIILSSTTTKKLTTEYYVHPSDQNLQPVDHRYQHTMPNDVPAKWLEKLNKLADDGNHEAKALLDPEKPTVTLYAALKVLEVAGDEEASQRRRYLRDKRRLYHYKKKKGTQDDFLISGEVPDSESVTIRPVVKHPVRELRPASLKGLSHKDIVAKAKAGDLDAMAWRDHLYKVQSDNRKRRIRQREATEAVATGQVVGEEPMDSEVEEDQEISPYSTSQPDEIDESVACPCGGQYANFEEERVAAVQAIEDLEEQLKKARAAELKHFSTSQALERKIAHLELEVIRARERRT